MAPPPDGLPELTPPFAKQPDDTFLGSISESLRTTRWVASNGNDGNDGRTRNTAWRTVARALVSDSDPTKDGINTWTALLIVGGLEPYKAEIRDTRGSQSWPGESTKPRVIRGVDNSGNPAPPSQRPVIVRSNSAQVIVLNSRYWILEGLVIDGKNEPRSRGVDVRGAQHVAVRNCNIRQCQVSAIELSEAQHVIIEGNILSDNGTLPKEHDSNGVSIHKNTRYVRVRGNVAERNVGDGVQCEGVEGVVRDITIEGNLFSDHFENAVDLKGCRNVDVLRNIELINRADSGQSAEAAVILHNSSNTLPARRVCIEQNRIFNSARGISLGRKDTGEQWQPVEDVVIRSNFIHNISPGTRGDGIFVQNARRVEVYDNVLHEMTGPGIAVRIDAGDLPTAMAADLRLWNNSISCAVGDPPDDRFSIVFNFTIERMPGLVSDYNFFAHPERPLRFRNRSTGKLLTWNNGIAWDTGVTTDVHSTGTFT